MQANTYQAIAITDGTLRSYAAFLYECGGVQWGGDIAMGSVFARVGISVGGVVTHSHPLSGNESVDTIDCLNEPNSRWVNLLYDISIRPSITMSATSNIPSALSTLLSTVPMTSLLVVTSGTSIIVFVGP